MPAATSRPTVAIVSDDPVFLSVIAEFLADEGYQTLTWADEVAAGEGVRQERPDLVVLDFRPDHPELESSIVSTIRQDASLRHIRILICSVDPRYIESSIRDLHEHGDDIIAKPFDLDVLMEKIEGLVGPTAVDNRGQDESAS